MEVQGPTNKSQELYRKRLRETNLCLLKSRMALLSRHLVDPASHRQVPHHSPHDHGPDRRHHNAAAIGAGIVTILARGLPLVAMQIEGKADGGALAWLAIVGHAFVVVRS